MVNLLVKFLSDITVRNLLLNIAVALAKKTSNTIDDDIVKFIKHIVESDKC